MLQCLCSASSDSQHNSADYTKSLKEGGVLLNRNGFRGCGHVFSLWFTHIWLISGLKNLFPCQLRCEEKEGGSKWADDQQAHGHLFTHTHTRTQIARTGGESKHVGGRSECYIVLCQISCQELHTPLNPYLGTGTFACVFMSCVVAHLICLPNLREFQMQFKFPKTYC